MAGHFDLASTSRSARGLTRYNRRGLCIMNEHRFARELDNVLQQVVHIRVLLVLAQFDTQLVSLLLLARLR
jgi:hypothetical protein